jgi:hypothetical protein
MAEFWTFSGVNSWSEAVGDDVDYVGEFVADKLHRLPDRRYSSRLGTTDHYDRAHNVVSLDSEKKLDQEAKSMARDGGGHPALKKGALKGRRVRVLLVAPKTTTKPPNPEGLFVEVIWSPNDQVPNQSLIRPDTLTYWREFVRGGGQVWPVENRLGQGLGKGHDYKGFMVDSPRIVKRKRTRKAGSKKYTYKWKTTGEMAPSPITTLRNWLNDPGNDYVLLAHSQGTNIAAHFLHRGYGN